jgi:hypothetical protein
MEQGEIRHLDEALNLHLGELNVLFLNDDTGYKVIRTGTIVKTKDENGKGTTSHKGTYNGRTDFV